jgi:hypothetical protein
VLSPLLARLFYSSNTENKSLMSPHQPSTAAALALQRLQGGANTKEDLIPEVRPRHTNSGQPPRSTLTVSTPPMYQHPPVSGSQSSPCLCNLTTPARGIKTCSTSPSYFLSSYLPCSDIGDQQGRMSGGTSCIAQRAEVLPTISSGGWSSGIFYFSHTLCSSHRQTTFH